MLWVLCVFLSAAEVDKFLLGNDGSTASLASVATADSRFKNHLSPSTVSSWLTLLSKCGLEQQVQVCTHYIVAQNIPVDFSLLASLDPTHSDQLLAEMQCDSSQLIQSNRLLSFDLRCANKHLEPYGAGRRLKIGMPSFPIAVIIAMLLVVLACWVSLVVEVVQQSGPQLQGPPTISKKALFKLIDACDELHLLESEGVVVLES